jgi:ATP-dependent helicase/nuclease subunit A
MTRAESRLFVSAALPARTKDEEPSGSLDERLAQLRGKTDANAGRRKSLPSFLELLLPSLTSAQGPTGLFTLEPIPVLSRDELASLYRGGKKEGLSRAEAAKEASFFYNRALIIGQGTPFPAAIPASGLHLKSQDKTEGSLPAESLLSTEEDGIAPILKKAGLGAADFGSIVHGFLEDRLNKRPPLILPRIQARMKDDGIAAIQAEALKMADRFLASNLGQKSAVAVYRESEFPLVTAVNAGDKTIAVTGQIDLLFEEDDAVWVVDFKTDRVENPQQHYGQLAVYSRAVSDIFGKPVRAWIYYLRSGNAIEVSADIKTVSIEELVSEACAEDEKPL